jgi:hypothetical protein
VDATLVHLAQRESLSTIFTIDHDGFETYRVDGRKRLRILPPRERPASGFVLITARIRS